MKDSRIAGLYRLPIAERIRKLESEGWLSAGDARLLQEGRQVLRPEAADKMIENVVGSFALPMAVTPNFRVNDRDYLLPMVVEEPSIIAGLSAAARLARNHSGFSASCNESLLIGQIHVSIDGKAEEACAQVSAAASELMETGNGSQPRLTARGGGLRGIECRRLQLGGGSETIAVHLLVDTCDAMGANLVNTLCEHLAPRVAELCGGSVVTSILSNLADRSLVEASTTIRLRDLRSSATGREAVRDAIVRLSDIALVDRYRAATHNKGIMNGVDALAMATGNDWRAIEAGAHAYASSDDGYKPLATWSVDASGDLVGNIRLPLKVGIVGGTVESNPGAALGLRIAGVESATELAMLMAATGLAQNFAALRALAGSGIQRGHMRLHARSVAAAAGTPPELQDAVVEKLIEDGNIKKWRAEEIVATLRPNSLNDNSCVATAAGKVILLGEHAVVYGKHGLALPLPAAVSAVVDERDSAGNICIREWGLRQAITDADGGTEADGIAAAVQTIQRELGVLDRHVDIDVSTSLPQAMGLGSSAAIAVAIIRAFDRRFELGLDDDRVNDVAFACERLAHGTPSGIDNTVSILAVPMLFRRDESLKTELIALEESPPIVIAWGQQRRHTSDVVAGVGRRYDDNRERYESLFSEIDEIAIVGARALASADFPELGKLMNVCHGLLNAIEVSTPELESMIAIARTNGACGAKLTGAGGGGSIVALCPGNADIVEKALAESGFSTMRPG